jgi:DNA-binding NarL/FixJ family response regulator
MGGVAPGSRERAPSTPRARYNGWLGRSDERDTAIRELLAAGTSQARIAARLHVSYATIRAARQPAGVA